MPGVHVAWLADASEERARSAAEAFRVPWAALPANPAGLPPCDVVLLAIPLLPRAAYHEALAARGTAVFAEKPFALNANDHLRFMDLFPLERVGCGYMRRKFAGSILLKRAITEEWFGPLRRIRIAEGGRATKTGVDQSFQDLEVAAGGGILINLGCHQLDLAFHVTGATEYEIRSRRVVFDGATDRKAEGTIILKYVRGTSAAMCELEFCCSWLDRQDNRIEVEFEHAALIIPTTVDGAATVRPVGDQRAYATLTTTERGARTINQAFYLEWVDFLEGLEHGTATGADRSIAKSSSFERRRS
jgi:predicted dehydrogenase